jgi:hypothetical protein
MPLAYEPQSTTMKLPNATAWAPNSADRSQEESYWRDRGGVSSRSWLFSGTAEWRMWIRADLYQSRGAGHLESNGNPRLGYRRCSERAVPRNDSRNGEMGCGAAATPIRVSHGSRADLTESNNAIKQGESDNDPLPNDSTGEFGLFERL